MGNTHSKRHKSFSRFIKTYQENNTPVNKKIPEVGVIPAYEEVESIRHIPDDLSVIIPLSPTSADSSILSSDESVKSVVLTSGKYQNYYRRFVLPVEEEEQDRLIQEHFLYKHIFDGNFSSPVRDLLAGSYKETSSKRNSVASSVLIEDIAPPRILDVACGNGTWLLEMATEFPNSLFYGIDFSPTYPTTVKPANAFFCQYDILHPDGFPYPDSYFDYVFMRQVSTCFSEFDWITIIKEIKRVLKPGGYVEFREVDPILYDMGDLASSILSKYPSLMKEKHGVNVLWARHMFEYLREFGEMTDLHRKVKKLRFGTDGTIGEMINISLRLGFESRRLFFQSSLNIPRDKYNEMVKNILKEAIEEHSFFNYHMCWGRKPLLDYDSSTSLRKGSIASGLTYENKSLDKTDTDPSENCEMGSYCQDNELCIDQFIEGFED